MNFPFNQIETENKLTRTFSIDVEEEELKWHQDLKDREVKIIRGGNWKFQMEDQLPIFLHDGQILSIPKMTWHRVIKGDSELIVDILEY